MARLSKVRTGEAHRVLVVEDDPQLLESTRRLLASHGFEVRGAQDTQSGLARAREFKPGVVLLDYYLGDGVGADFVREVRRFDELVQVVLVTGYAAEQPARKLLKELDIQGYHDKADGAERLLVWIDASVKHFELLERMQRQQTYLRRILEATPSVTALQPAIELLREALCGLTRILQGGDGIIATENNGLFVLDDADAGVSLHAGTGQFSEVRGFAALPPHMADAIRVGFALEKPTLYEGGHVLVPLRTRTGARGCMAVAATAFPDEAIDPAEIFGRHVVQALENVILYERATVDPLTSLYQRAFGLQRLDETLRLGSRTLTSTSVLMIDVDHFKALNDGYGHAAGDLALRAIARAIRGACRTSDIVCRYGGEEILAVLPATSSPGALILAERVRSSVDALRISFEGDALRCTASIGVASHDPESNQKDGHVDPDAVVRRADAALYRAKDGGRNRVVVDGDPA